MAPKKRERKETRGGGAGGGAGPSSPPPVKKKKRSRHLDPEDREDREGRKMQMSLEAALESVVPPIVEKVFTRLFTSFFGRVPSTLVDENHPPRYKLKFLNGLATKIFTRKVICDRNGEPLKICITATHQEGADSQILSAKVRVVVLDGDFNKHNQECWTREEFSNSIARPRDKVAALLAGDPELSLTNGEACLCGFTFLDNSKFMRSGKFRLGVMVIDNLGERVQEGITEPFIVKERRGEGSEKHDIPLLNDYVWRLNKISKNGASHVALKGSGILFVKDFLRLYYRDEQALRNILIWAKESVWTAIVEHAKKCCPGTELYSFIVEGKSVILFFNSVCQIVGAKFDDNYTSFDDLEKYQKDMVVKWSKIAYKKMTYDQHDYEMDSGKPRPINQEMLHGLSILEHGCADPMQGHSIDTNGNVCLPDDQQVTSGSHSKQHESTRLESMGNPQNEVQKHLDGMVPEVLPQLEEVAAWLQELHDQDEPVQEELEEAAAWLQELHGQDEPRQEAAAWLQEQHDQEEPGQEATPLLGQNDQDELDQEAAPPQDQHVHDEPTPLPEEQDQDEPEQEATWQQEQQNKDKLEQEAVRLRVENERVVARAADIDADYTRVEQENTMLRAHAAELGSRLEALNGVLQVFRLAGAPCHEICSGAMPGGATTVHMLSH
ncbi:hypothetical protein EJB05_01169, partial [Eragrostis curvula]